jgi:CRP/FNR family transcriptional regulator
MPLQSTRSEKSESLVGRFRRGPERTDTKSAAPPIALCLALRQARSVTWLCNERLGKEGMMSKLMRVVDERYQHGPLSSAGQPAAGESCGMADLLRLMGGDSAALASYGEAQLPVALRRLQAAEALFHEGAPAEALYFVRAGTFKSYRTAEDGYEQVLAFAGRAELLGFDGLDTGRHPNAAVALEDSSVYVVPLRDFLAAGPRCPAFDRLLQRAVSVALSRRGELAELMGAVAAEVRLVRFLLQLSQRMAACGQSPRRFHLRMGRRDIASYLGVAHETVSRSFAALARWGLVCVDNREVEILDMPGLKAFALNTRRQMEDGAHMGVHLAALRTGIEQCAA